MAFDQIKDSVNEVTNNAKQYIDTSIKYYSLLGFKITAKAAIILFKSIILSLLVLLALFLFSFAAAYGIGQYFKSYAIGFVIVGIFYLIVTALFFKYGNKILEKHIIKVLSEIFFKE